MRVDKKDIRELNLPKIPQAIIDRINRDYNKYVAKWSDKDSPYWKNNNLEYPEDWSVAYILSDSFNHDIDVWCKQNISNTIDWEFQIINRDLDIHRDFDIGDIDEIIIHTKFIYIIEPGGSNVLTHFYKNDAITLIESYKLEPHKWYLFNTLRHHNITGIEPNKVRFAIVGHVF